MRAGEDTDLHQNDVLWYYDWASSSLTRFLSTPYGSETTSPYFYPNINGWAYITAVVQHPYGESDEEQMCATASFFCLHFDLNTSVPVVSLDQHLPVSVAPGHNCWPCMQ